MLLEALVALLIFSIGVLGIVGLQASMTKAQTGSKFRADAAFLAQRLIGSMWSDRSGLNNYDTTARLRVAHAAAASGLPKSPAAARRRRNSRRDTLRDVDRCRAVVIAAEVTITINWTPPNEEQRTLHHDLGRRRQPLTP